MATAVQWSYENFQDEFDKAKESLKDVDENIKKLTGRDPKVVRRRRGIENVATSDTRVRRESTSISSGKREWKGDTEERRGPRAKRIDSRDGNRRRSRRNSQEDDDFDNKPSIQSSVVSNPNRLLLKTRTDSLNELKSDKKVLARNRRMFGLLVGTLQKFHSEQSAQNEKVQKRQEIEEKVEEAEKLEREQIKKERQELFIARKKQQSLLKRLERKMEIARHHEQWERHQRYLLGFIKTETSPHIMFLPSISSTASDQKHKQSSSVILEEIVRRRKQMEDEIKMLDEEEARDLAKIDVDNDDRNEDQDDLGHSSQPDMNIKIAEDDQLKCASISNGAHANSDSSPSDPQEPGLEQEAGEVASPTA